MSKTKKLLALVLSVLTFLGVFSCSTTVFAEEYNGYVAEREYQDKLLTEAVENEKQKAEIVCEVPEKRDEFSKTYKRADGSFTTVFSKTPLHSYDGSEWKEIDNSLQSNGDVIENADGKFNIVFPESLSSDNKITIENQGENISFSLNNIDASTAEVASKEETADIIENDLEKPVSEITYENIDENTDVQYIVSSNSVKENIIVSDKNSLKDTYSFDIEKGDLIATLGNDNSVTFKNAQGEVSFTIPAPVMTDAENTASYDITVSIANENTDTLTLTYTPSKEWLESNKRVYPVTIDPVIFIEEIDTTLLEAASVMYHENDSSYENKNFSQEASGIVANNAPESGFNITQAETLIKFNMSMFATLNTPEIVVTNVNYFLPAYISGGNILVKEIIGDWDASEITYRDIYPTDNSQPVITYGENIIDYCTGIPGMLGTGDMIMTTFNITNLFNKWLTGTNTGFAVVAEENSAALLLSSGNIGSNSFSSRIFTILALVSPPL